MNFQIYILAFVQSVTFFFSDSHKHKDKYKKEHKHKDHKKDKEREKSKHGNRYSVCDFSFISVCALWMFFN